MWDSSVSQQTYILAKKPLMSDPGTKLKWGIGGSAMYFCRATCWTHDQWRSIAIIKVFTEYPTIFRKVITCTVSGD